MDKDDRPGPPGSLQRPQRLRKPSRLPDIDPGRCTGCGRCVAACDVHVLSLETVRWQKFAVLHDAQQCTGCSLCAVKCPFGAITMRVPPKAATSLDGYYPPAEPG